MPQYTTGELARLCGVSVRTVQYYDSKHLLQPTERAAGGRRLYTESDLHTLRLICTLKSLGLSLRAIRDILQSDAPHNLLLLLLDEQEKHIRHSLAALRQQRRALRAVRAAVANRHTVPLESFHGIEDMMKNQSNLKRTRAILLLVGILMDVIALGGLFLWIFRGIWQPFAIAIPVVILTGVLLTRMYYRNTAYICPECHTQFKPPLWRFLFSSHTPKTRKLPCPHCGYVGYCVETASGRGQTQA